MNPKPENEKAPDNQTPSSQTPTEEPGKAAPELAEDTLKQVVGGGFRSAIHDDPFFFDSGGFA